MASDDLVTVVSPLADDQLAHVSVLYEDTLSGLAVRPGGRYIDGTVGAGGHAAGILERSSPDGLLLGLDADEEAITRAGQRLAVFGPRVMLCRRNFSSLARGRKTWLCLRFRRWYLVGSGAQFPTIGQPGARL